MNEVRLLKKMVEALALLVVCSCLSQVRAQSGCTNMPDLLEADVFPSFSVYGAGGDGMIRYLDWQFTLRYVVRLREPLDGCELAVADCAPRSTLGDGLLTVTDVAQAFRYSLLWDTPTFVGGPATPAPTLPRPGLGTRSVHISGDRLVRGADNTLLVTLRPAGDEFATAFTLEFNPTQLRFVQALRSSTNAAFLINTNEHVNGRLGIAVWGYPGIKGEMVSLTFHAVDGTNTSATLHFSDAIAKCEIGSTNADPLLAVFTPATFEFTTKSPRITPVGHGGDHFDFRYTGETGAQYRVECSTDLTEWFPITVYTTWLGSGEWQFSDRADPLPPLNFYRLRMLP